MSRPGSRGFGRPPTSSYGAPGGGRLGTSLQGTARLGTSMQAAGFAAGSEVKVEHRPVTRDGMEGIRLGTAGPGRQVQDVSYYTGMIRRKCEEIVNEMERLGKEGEQIEADKVALATFERRYEDLVQSVRDLEGTLADHNLALDKARSGSDVSDQRRYCDMIRERNAEFAREADEVFRERQRREEAIESLQRQAADMREKEQQRMASLPPELRRQVEDLTLSNNAWLDQARQLNTRLETLVRDCARADMEVKQNKWREEYRQLEARLVRLEKDREQLRDEAETANLDPREARQRLLQKAKESTAKLSATKEDLHGEEEARDQLQAKLRGVERQLEQRRSATADSSKVEMLVQRDREITEYIEEEFPERMRAAQARVGDTQQTVVALLEHISSEMQRTDNLPSRERVEDMAEDLSFKKGQMDLSKQTLDRLQAERASAEKELAKLHEVDKRVPRQMAQLRGDIDRLGQEEQAYRDIDALRQQHQDICQFLEGRYREYMARTAGLEGTVHLVTASYKASQEGLARDKNARELEELENRMRRYAQQVFELQEFVNDKTAGTNFELLRQQCMDKVAEINACVKELAAAQ